MLARPNKKRSYQHAASFVATHLRPDSNDR